MREAFSIYLLSVVNSFNEKILVRDTTILTSGLQRVPPIRGRISQNNCGLYGRHETKRDKCIL